MTDNARRISACIAACQGIPTEVLEAQQSGGLPWSVADQIEARVVQDALVAALRELRAEAVVLSREYLDIFKYDPDDTTIQGWDKGRWLRAIEAYEKAGAAISKAEGGRK